MNECFDFRIVKADNGTEVIDRNRITPFTALTPTALVEYKQMENNLYYMDIQKRKQEREAERNRKIARNPLYKLACMCGII